jgi:sugar phosphate isomerase/epimerase
MRLAVENHKDLTSSEIVEMLKLLGSEWIGVQVDTGNNMALLEDPYAVVEALAPYAFSVHLKDMAVEATEDGFLLSEVVFGEGLLDLARMTVALRAARPGIAFNVEMATRDPLRIPCLTDEYWATFPERVASDFAARWTWIRDNLSRKALPRVSHLGAQDRLALEEKNNRRCIAWLRESGLIASG